MERYELYHHGVKGMRWGVRKAHPDHVEAHKRKRVRNMSNEELKKRNNRLQLETQYRDLKGKSGAGKRLLKGFIAGAATITAVTSAYAVYKKTGKNVAGAILDKAGDIVVKGIDLSGNLT